MPKIYLVKLTRLRLPRKLLCVAVLSTALNRQDYVVMLEHRFGAAFWLPSPTARAKVDLRTERCQTLQAPTFHPVRMVDFLELSLPFERRSAIPRSFCGVREPSETLSNSLSPSTSVTTRVSRTPFRHPSQRRSWFDDSVLGLICSLPPSSLRDTCSPSALSPFNQSRLNPGECDLEMQGTGGVGNDIIWLTGRP